MGESLARKEVFLFTVNLIKSLRFQLPDNHPVPHQKDCVLNFTTIPKDFYVKISLADI